MCRDVVSNSLQGKSKQSKHWQGNPALSCSHWPVGNSLLTDQRLGYRVFHPKVFPLSCYFLQFPSLDRWKTSVTYSKRRFSWKRDVNRFLASNSDFRRNCQRGGPASLYPSPGRKKGKDLTPWLWECRFPPPLTSISLPLKLSLIT